MIRRIVEIDEKKCNGCGACANACHENAIVMVEGKAKLIKDDYCDGLGDCLPACPMDAIEIIEREAAAYDEIAVKERMKKEQNAVEVEEKTSERAYKSMLQQWPVQIKLLPIKAPYFDKADLLIAADCTAYAYAGFHERFMKDHITVIGCPKLDSVDYSEKLTEIFKNNEIRSIQVVRMEVPCCGGLSYAVEKALQASGKDIPCHVETLLISD